MSQFSGMVGSGTLADRPASYAYGRLYYVTDVGDERWTFDNGSSWVDCTTDYSYVGAAPAGGSPAFSAGTSSAALNSVVFSNSNGVSFGLNGSTITASHNGLTTAMASNRGSDFVQANAAFAGTNASGTIASNGISVSVNAGGGDAIRGIAANGSTASTNTVHFSNANGISFGFGAAGNSTVITASHNAITTGALSNHSHGVSFTSGSVAFQTLSFTNSNGISFNSGTQGIFASHNAITTARASNDAVGLATAQTNVTWTVNSAGLSLNAAGYAGTGTSATNASITLNSNGLAISVAAPGGGAGATMSTYGNLPYFVNTTTMTMLQSTSGVYPFRLDNNLSFEYMVLPISASVLAASSTAATTGNTSYSAGHTRSLNVVVYTRGTGANSTALFNHTSTQVTYRYAMTMSHATNSTQHSYTLNYTFPCSSGTTGFTKNYSSSAASLNFHTSQLTDITGIKRLEMPFAGSLSAGQYWLVYGISSSVATQRTADQSRAAIAWTNIGVSNNTLAFGSWGSATNSSVQMFQGHGSFTTAGGGTVTKIPFSAISSTSAGNMLHFQLMRAAT